MSYAMFTFMSDNPRGPFKPRPPDLALVRRSRQRHPPLPTGTGVQQLACWVRGNGELLISNYLTWGNIVLLPLRKPVVDADGHLRLGYWKNNDAAKGGPLAKTDQCEQGIPPRTSPARGRFPIGAVESRGHCRRRIPALSSRAAALLRQGFDMEQGVILEGTIEVGAAATTPATRGSISKPRTARARASRVEASDAASRCSHVGALKLGKQWDFRSCDETGPGCATVTGIAPGRKHTFRLWMHHNIFELYIDDLLMQTMAIGERTGRIGFLVQNGAATVADLKPGRSIYKHLREDTMKTRNEGDCIVPARHRPFTRIRFWLSVALLVAGTRLAVGAPPVDAHGRPLIQKLGTVVCDQVENSPFVFRGRLYRLEARAIHLVDCESGKTIPLPLSGWGFANAFVDGDTVYLSATQDVSTGRRKVRMWSSRDLNRWDTWIALDLPGYEMFNTSICKAERRFVMMFEIAKPVEEAGVPFTARFATSDDLKHWTVTPPDCVYAKDRYTAPHCLRYLDGYYYDFYLEAHPRPPL